MYVRLSHLITRYTVPGPGPADFESSPPPAFFSRAKFSWKTEREIASKIITNFPISNYVEGEINQTFEKNIDSSEGGSKATTIIIET